MLTETRIFPSLNVIVRFCDFSRGPENSNTVVKYNNSLQKRTSGKGLPLQF